MDTFENWPESLRNHLAHCHGSPLAMERLGGMSRASVVRLRFADRSLVVKSSPSPRERLLYEYGGEQLRQAGVALPECLWSAEIDEVTWLVLEDIPNPLPLPERAVWQPDRRIVAMLARLHNLVLDLPPEMEAIATWRWDDAMSDAALSFFDPAIAGAIGPPLRDIQTEAERLDTPWCWVSGDPNPSNWGERADGTPVLYDWELVRRGVPALDLAIIVSGLGNRETYEAAATAYVEEWSQLTIAPSWNVARLPRDIALAKVWTVASLLRACVTGGGRLPETLQAQLTEYVPPWILSIAREREARS